MVWNTWVCFDNQSGREQLEKLSEKVMTYDPSLFKTKIDIKFKAIYALIKLFLFFCSRYNCSDFFIDIQKIFCKNTQVQKK